jgi:hypothetical protein
VVIVQSRSAELDLKAVEARIQAVADVSLFYIFQKLLLLNYRRTGRKGMPKYAKGQNLDRFQRARAFAALSSKIK